ncbi:uncharacterized protein BXIN_0168 [Babesia sp. Xinjiang]|uniref:uncharacterized protein n=1 Tax=Babesia sp. Xinjiang TaxID=462227 RepID=UPI000A22FB4B|nr:uncharacterized protein BXIN_0168 [Babesia sp. Xinjiang]ORM39820.1 hypothetical protein BXIN_0168 [Babesia sp. Xinjiang]
MYRIFTTLLFIAMTLMRTSECIHASDMVLCADMCPSSTLVAEDGVGISKCYDACKRLIHRVRYGDVIDSVDKKTKVKAPKESALKRIKQGFGNMVTSKAKPSASE